MSLQLAAEPSRMHLLDKVLRNHHSPFRTRLYRKPPSHRKLRMSEPFVVLIAILGVVLAGRSILTLIDRICGTIETPRAQSEIWGLSILLGVSFTAAAGFVWSDFGGQLTASFAWKQTILATVLGLVATGMSLRRKLNLPVDTSIPSSPFLTRFFRVALGLVLAGAFGLSLFPPDLEGEGLTSSPDRVEIERQAQVLLETGTIDAPELVPEGGYPAHFRRPLLLPLAQRHLAGLLGRPSEIATGIWSPLCLAGLALSFAGVLGRRTAGAWGWMLATGLAVMPLMWVPEFGVLARMADVPAASFHGVALLMLWDALQTERGRVRASRLLIAAGMASSCVFTKSEGLIYLLGHVLAWSVATLGSRGESGAAGEKPGFAQGWGREQIGIAIFVLFAAFLLTPWMLYRHGLPTRPVTAVPARTAELIQDLLQLIRLDWWKAGLPWGLLLLAVVSSPRRSWEVSQRFLLLAFAIALALAALLLAPVGLKEHLGGSSRPLLLHLTPLAMLLIAAAWRPSRVVQKDSTPATTPK